MNDNDKNKFINDEEDQLKEYFQFDKMDIHILEKNSQKRYIEIIFILIILIIILILIILIVTNKDEEREINCKDGYFLPNDDSKKNCEKCSLDNCKKCSGSIESNICIDCQQNFFPFIENKKIKACVCNLEDINCLECDKKKIFV